MDVVIIVFIRIKPMKKNLANFVQSTVSKVRPLFTEFQTASPNQPVIPSATIIPATIHVAYPMVVFPKMLYHWIRRGVGIPPDPEDLWRSCWRGVVGHRRRPMREAFRRAVEANNMMCVYLCVEFVEGWLV